MIFFFFSTRVYFSAISKPQLDQLLPLLMERQSKLHNSQDYWGTAACIKDKRMAFRHSWKFSWTRNLSSRRKCEREAPKLQLFKGPWKCYGSQNIPTLRFQFSWKPVRAEIKHSDMWWLPNIKLFSVNRSGIRESLLINSYEHIQISKLITKYGKYAWLASQLFRWIGGREVLFSS